MDLVFVANSSILFTMSYDSDRIRNSGFVASFSSDISPFIIKFKGIFLIVSLVEIMDVGWAYFQRLNLNLKLNLLTRANLGFDNSSTHSINSSLLSDHSPVSSTILEHFLHLSNSLSMAAESSALMGKVFSSHRFPAIFGGRVGVALLLNNMTPWKIDHLASFFIRDQHIVESVFSIQEVLSQSSPKLAELVHIGNFVQNFEVSVLSVLEPGFHHGVESWLLSFEILQHLVGDSVEGVISLVKHLVAIGHLIVMMSGSMMHFFFQILDILFLNFGVICIFILPQLRRKLETSLKV